MRNANELEWGWACHRLTSNNNLLKEFNVFQVTVFCQDWCLPEKLERLKNHHKSQIAVFGQTSLPRDMNMKREEQFLYAPAVE